MSCRAATERGVVVMNTPSGNHATAEAYITHMLCGARPCPAAASMREARGPQEFFGIELYKNPGRGRVGRIGARAIARKLLHARPAYDPFSRRAAPKAMQVEQVDLDTLLRISDYITVHMPLTEQTRYMIDEAALAKTKKGVRLFNCARGESSRRRR